MKEVQQLETSTKGELFERMQKQLEDKEEEIHRLKSGSALGNRSDDAVNALKSADMLKSSDTVVCPWPRFSRDLTMVEHVVRSNGIQGEGALCHRQKVR